MSKKHVSKSSSKITILLYIFVPLLIVTVGLYFFIANTKPSTDGHDQDHSEEDIYDNPIPTDYPALLEFKKINSEIVGVLKVPNTAIDYPVVGVTSDDEECTNINYWLKHNYKREDTIYGSIIADITATGDLTGKNIIIHGHDTKNGTMFGNLKKFYDINFYKQTPTFTFNGQTWKIFAVNELNIYEKHGNVFDFIVRYFNSDTEFLDYVQEIMTRSLIKTSVTLNERDRLMLLSTCSDTYREGTETTFRTVIYARQIRKGESEQVDVSNAIANPDPLKADVFYSGAQKKPQLFDFNTALEKGLTYWYDGKLSA